MKYLVNDPTVRLHCRELRKNQTDLERLLWMQLRNKQLEGVKFFRQYSIGAYIVDFYSPRLRLAIEVDGGQHNETINKQKDIARTRYLQNNGVKLIRFWNNDVLRNLEGVLETILLNLRNPS